MEIKVKCKTLDIFIDNWLQLAQFSHLSHLERLILGKIWKKAFTDIAVPLDADQFSEENNFSVSSIKIALANLQRFNLLKKENNYYIINVDLLPLSASNTVTYYMDEEEFNSNK